MFGRNKNSALEYYRAEAEKHDVDRHIKEKIITDLTVENARLKERMRVNREWNPILASVHYIEGEGWRLRIDGPKGMIGELLSVLEKTPFRLRDYFQCSVTERKDDVAAILVPRKKKPSEKKGKKDRPSRKNSVFITEPLATAGHVSCLCCCEDPCTCKGERS